MEKLDPAERDKNRQMLADARAAMAVLREALMATAERLRTEEALPRAGDIKSAAADFARAVNKVVEIEDGLAKRTADFGNGGGALDLGAARREILERLARRAGRDGGAEISG